MSDVEFDFGDDSVAGSYDDVLVPMLFEPWAARLVEDNQPWEGQHVVDLATGTGIVARALVDEVGQQGRVTGVDLNGAMLARARKRCEGLEGTVEFMEGPAYPLDLPDGCADTVVCQQGFQFFPDKPAAAREIYRVLKPGGRAIVATWRPVSECEFFGAICGALVEIGKAEVTEAMRVPFDFMPAEELAASFRAAGFAAVRVEQLAQDLVMEGGNREALGAAYATPIGPSLRDFSEELQDAFGAALTRRLDGLSGGETTMGSMVSDMLTTAKPAESAEGQTA